MTNPRSLMIAMDGLRPVQSLFFPTPVTPTLLDLRFQDLITSVWAWTKQMEKNEKSSKLFSPILKQAFYAYSEVISKLEAVLNAFYSGKTKPISKRQLETDLDELESFARVICGDYGSKLQLQGVEGKLLVVFPAGAPFIAEQIVLDVIADCRIDEKIVKLNDTLLQSSFQDAIRAFFEFVKETCSTHQTMQEAFNEDQRKLNLKCASWDVQYREMEVIRSSLIELPRNTICCDTRVKGWEKNISVSAALDRVAKSKADMKSNIQLYHAQTHFNNQLCQYLELEVPTGLDDLSV